ncbi:glucosyltransferase domain-containing protein [Psychrobacter celer]|uniref:glucosyltransferase domain-containing protein n=1 Tax=Psychrobacter celer TaxID=306572 RepID=UPI003FD12D7C
MLSKINSKHLIVFISVLLYLPLIMWDGYFWDDNYRSVVGYYAWSGDYRPLADYVYYVLGLGQDFVDTYPLNYIVQFLGLSYFIQYLSSQLIERWEIELPYHNYVIMAIFAIFFSPFFIQNLYFRYDSLTMMLSVLLVMATLVIENKKYHFAMLLAGLLLYQPTVIAYGVITCFRALLLIKNQSSRKTIYQEIFINWAILMLAMAVFFAISKLLLTGNTYAKSHFELVTSLQDIQENLAKSLDNLYFSNLLTDYGIWLGLGVLALIAVFQLLSSNRYLRAFDKLLIGAGIILVLVISVINVNILLYVPRLHSRIYVPVGFVLFFILFFTVIAFHNIAQFQLKKYYRFFQFCFFYAVLLLVNIYYSAYNYNREMDKRADELLSYLVYDLMQYKDINIIITNGSSRESERASVLSKRFPVLKYVYSHKFDTNLHRMIYILLINNGISFKKEGLRSLETVKQYNHNLNTKADISNQTYDVVVENVDVMEENKPKTMQNVFIYFKNEEGERIPLPLVNHRLSN